MPRRMEIELTAKRDDGTWTWRAPGAREPRGVVDGDLLPPDAKPGNILRAEAEFDLEGISVTSVLGSKTADRGGREGERIEILGTPMQTSNVSVSLASRGGGKRGPNLFDDRPPKRRSGPPSQERGDRDRPQRDRDRPARDGDRPPRDGERPPRDGARPAGDRNGAASTRPRRPERTSEPAGSRRPREDRPAGPDGGGEPSDREPRRRPEGGRPPRTGPARPGAPDRSGRPRAPQASTEHRNAALALLRPEQLPVAEQLLRGGIPGLRKAIEEQNARARSEGRTEVDPQPLLSMADELLPKMNLAAWKDRAVAARAADRDCPLRELRAVVAAASTVNVDDEGRELQSVLRKSLETRVTALRESWLSRIGKALDDGRVVDALQVASRAPEPAMRLPAELAVRLSDSAGAAMKADLDNEGWLHVLQAVVASPVKRTVKPEALPADVNEEVRNAARNAAGSVPQLARLLGLPIPPPPGPRRPPRPVGVARRGAPA